MPEAPEINKIKLPLFLYYFFQRNLFLTEPNSRPKAEKSNIQGYKWHNDPEKRSGHGRLTLVCQRFLVGGHVRTPDERE